MKAKAKQPQQPNPARKPDYTDFRRTGRGSRVRLAIWVNETEKGLRFGTKLQYEYLTNGNDWKEMENPLPEQWLATGKMLSDADTWRHRYLQERHQAANGDEQM